MSAPSVFIVLVGGYGNIGDAVIRRRSLEAFRGLGPVHAYVGNAPADWIDQIGLDALNDTIYDASQSRRWVRNMASNRGRKVLVLDPGEVLLTKRQLPKELGFLAMTILARASGAEVLRMPRAVRSPSPMVTSVHRLACRFSNLVLWREKASLDLIGRGTLVADIAFTEPVDEKEFDRGLMVVSMRGPRQFPNTAWFEGVLLAAAQLRLQLVVVSQVREDEIRGEQIARRLPGAVFQPWGERSDAGQERFVRTLYDRASLVVSDRLHALILGLLHGAGVAEVVPQPSGKAASHFATIGDEDVSRNSMATSPEDIASFLSERVRTKDEARLRVENARLELERELLFAQAHAVGQGGK
ncbi:polysaccharide pyruvyl transferase family protein [Agromyces sp. PvR057]|uniref:polysaccharide pyruvyl transferase family protein n=1 Tax=Agromyces sp. PvR057 TaxID=3156403 RepID=UPI00339B496B